MVRRIAHQTQGKSAQIISPAAHEGRSRYWVKPPIGTSTAATYAAAGGTSYERTRRKAPSAPTSASRTFTPEATRSRLLDHEATSPMAIRSGDHWPHWPSAAMLPARQVGGSITGHCPCRTRSPRWNHQP